jgi:glycosyltransferase involved in cell wall biosynthesis
VGRLVQLKRVHYLIALAENLQKKKFSDFEICIVGDGDEYDHLRNEVKSKALAKQVRFLGFQENTEPFYRRFDLFILPSQEECLSIALIDAGLCGIPAIAFDVGGNSEIILHEKTGYIVSSLDDLIARTHTLIKEKDLRLRLGNAARDYCEKTFGQETRKENLLALR